MDNQRLNDFTDEYDKEFLNLIMEIEKRSSQLRRHDQLRIKSWCKKLCQVTNNIEWKKNRNLHTICWWDSIWNENFEDPYNKFAPEGAIPIINKTVVKSKLSAKFIKNTKNMHNEGKEGEEFRGQGQGHQGQEKGQGKIKKCGLNNNNNTNFNNHSSNPSGNIKTEDTEKRMKNNEGSSANDDIPHLKNMVTQLQKDNHKKDQDIERWQEEINQMEKRIQELEKMLSSFMEMNK